MLRRSNILAVIVVVTALGGLSACPDRAEVVDTVGSAPGRQVDEARHRTKAAEDKIKANTDAAAAIE